MKAANSRKILRDTELKEMEYTKIKKKLYDAMDTWKVLIKFR